MSLISGALYYVAITGKEIPVEAATVTYTLYSGPRIHGSGYIHSNCE